MFYKLIRSCLFTLPPEVAHDVSLKPLKYLAKIPGLQGLFPIPQQPVSILGLTFPNPVGLAAGLDKNGDYIDALGMMGFGFIEVGTVTPVAQPGNDKPRMFRVKPAEGIINRMGFNNYGVQYLVQQVKKAKYKGIIGINIGKNKVTPAEKALDDYLICLNEVYPHADYIAINISSPNTPGLRDLQHGEALDTLLAGIKERQLTLKEQYNKYVPVLVKIAPDLTDTEIDELAQAFIKHNIDGVIATNTTNRRDIIDGLPHYKEQGGLSGKPVFDDSTEVLRKFAKKLDGKMPIIGVGGVDSVETAQAKLDAGASLVQVYTGFIYQGPGLVKKILKGLGNT
mgnify:CR=1 FL=1|tara:strand:+ start:2918 stop:3934 length:1017 start_codon:yes stop_codon:yes gene_type:complete